MNQELANKAVTLAVLKKRVAELEAEVKAEISATMDRGDRKVGKAGDAKIGAVTLTDPKAAYRVTNGDAWRAWVRDNFPDEITTVEAVRSSFETAVLGRGGVIDEATGEVTLPDGVALVEGVPVVQVRPEKDAEAAIRAELQKSGASFVDVLASLQVKAVEA